MPSRTTRLARGCAILGFSLVILVAGASGARAQCPSGSALLGPPIDYPVGANTTFAAMGDFNEDGILDIAINNGDVFNSGIDSRLNVLLGLGNRAYAPAVRYPVGRNAHGVVAADFDEDGILDLAVANKWSDEVSVLRGNGTAGQGDGTFAAAVQYPVSGSPFDLVTADFDGDGILDLATCLNSSNGVAVLRGAGTGGVGNGAFSPAVVFPTSSISTGLEVGDFNRDGAPDLVATQYSTATVAILMNQGGPGLSFTVAHYAAGPQPFGAAVADFDEDGIQDLAVANTASGGTAILRGNSSGGFSAPAILPTGNVGSVVAADLNQDGILDLAIGVNFGDGTGFVRVHLGQGAGGVGNGSFGAATAYPVGHDAYQLLSGDFDADGSIDLFVSDNDASQLRPMAPITLLPGVCEAAPPDTRSPVLTAVRDVPNDQGGKVFVTWQASSLDQPGGAVNQYRVWRRIPPAELGATSLESASGLRISTRLVRPDGTSEVVYWEALATLPAQRLPGYGYTAATTQDSMRNSNPYTAFFVSALTSNIDVFYSSNVDSGYSVDNIKPNSPQHLVGQLTASGVELGWDENGDPDLSGYRLYRGGSADFVPSESNRIAAPHEPGFVDAGASGADFYKLSAIDEAENESDFAALQPLLVAGVGGHGVGFALYGVRPNPSLGGRWSVDLSLAAGVPARLELIDASGRRVATRELEPGPGARSVSFEIAERLPAGVYLVRLSQGARRSDSKVTVIR